MQLMIQIKTKNDEIAFGNNKINFNLKNIYFIVTKQ